MGNDETAMQRIFCDTDFQNEGETSGKPKKLWDLAVYAAQQNITYLCSEPVSVKLVEEAVLNFFEVYAEFEPAWECQTTSFRDKLAILLYGQKTAIEALVAQE